MESDLLEAFLHAKVREVPASICVDTLMYGVLLFTRRLVIA